MATTMKPDFYKRWKRDWCRTTVRFLNEPIYEYKEKIIMSEDTKIEVQKDALEEIRDIFEELRAIETLEYHNKNLLALDDPKRSIYKSKRLSQAIEILEHYVQRTVFF